MSGSRVIQERLVKQPQRYPGAVVIGERTGWYRNAKGDMAERPVLIGVQRAIWRGWTRARARTEAGRYVWP